MNVSLEHIIQAQSAREEAFDEHKHALQLAASASLFTSLMYEEKTAADSSSRVGILEKRNMFQDSRKVCY